MTSKYKIFALIFLPASLAVVFGLALVQQKNKDLSARQFEEQLKNQWRLVSIIQRTSLDSERFKAVGDELGLRVSLIDRHGVVNFDNGGQDEVLEDHSQREEVRNAFLGAPTMSARRSATTGLYTIYYADKLSDDLVLRVAYPADYYQRQEGALLAQTFSGLTGLIVAVAVFAFLVSRSTGRTLQELSRAVAAAEKGSLVLQTFGAESLDSALHSLSAATRELKQSGERNAALNARLLYILGAIQEGVILIQDQSVVFANDKASEILNSQVPKSLSEINKADLLAVFESLTGPNPPAELNVGGRIVSASRHRADQTTLIILRDISDRIRYSGYKSDLVANISHELKTPLALIMAVSEVLAKDSEMPAEKREKFLKTVHGNAKRLNSLLDDLIALHKLESTQEVEASQSDLEEIAADVAGLVDPKDKRIDWFCDKGQVNINSSHVASVLVNLISNAVKYSQGPNVEVSLKRLGRELEITVSDHGPAIPVSERERIFERFYSLSASRNRENSGSGLGLSIVKHIARLYGGQAQLLSGESSGPSGSSGNVFRVTLTEKADGAFGEPADETAGEYVGESVGETAGETTMESADETANEASGKTVGESVHETTVESAGETVNETVGKTADETTGQTANEAAGETFGEPADETAGEFVGELADESVRETAGETTLKSAGEIANEAAGETLGGSADKTD
ncbi:MAG: hypothetical protein LBJ64_12185 [Deltaproteobacteria bacterium]|jgi:two-component system phosphate regulon sensor histidine kinase PhoR|nr:hypothetical protein [Deltaproteobacteria bacterium]